MNHIDITTPTATALALPHANERWSDAEVQQLVTLFDSGLSASRIAAALGNGKTRNAVLGKLFRMGKLKRGFTMAPAIEDRERPRPPKPPRAKPSLPALARRADPRERPPPPIQPPAPVLREGERITILTLAGGMCKWPIGDPLEDDFRFCGHTQRDGDPYCAYHCGVAYQPVQARRTKRAEA